MNTIATVCDLPLEREEGLTKGSPQEEQKKWRAWYVREVGGRRSGSETVTNSEPMMGVEQW
jgi:hypothetical protein